jgi:hypothetical protein
LQAREPNEIVRHVRAAKPPPECGEPADGRDLYEVELVARGYSDGQYGLSLDRDLVLPAFDKPQERAWPPHEVPLAVKVAESMLAAVQRMPLPGSEWEHEIRKQRAAEQTAQLQAYYERQRKGAA